MMTAIFSELKAAGIELFGEIGAWAYDEWNRLNLVFFDGNNRPGPIYWVPGSQIESLGGYLFSQNTIYLHKGLVRPRYPTNSYRWCFANLNQRLSSDVLLHEMIHQMIHQNGSLKGEDSHNNERFVNQVNKIARLLRLNVTAKVVNATETNFKQMPADGDAGHMTLKELSNFPYSTRPYAYYYGVR